VTQISVDAGRLYSAGKVYSSGTTAWSKDFITQLPVAGKKIVAVVTWGSEADTDVRPRQFLVNAETRQAEPQAVPLVHARVANLNVVIGTEAPDPTAPLVDVGYTIIALVTLSPTGVDLVKMVTDNQLPTMQGHEDRIVDLEEFEVTAGLQMKTLGSDIAALKAAGSKAEVDQATMGRTLTRLAVLESKNGVVYTAIDSSANFFLDTTKSLLTDPLSHVKVEEGIRFPHAAEGLSALQIFNPLDVNAKIKNGVLFPAYTREAWLQSGSINGELQVAAYSVSSFDMVQKQIARQRIRYGGEFIVCTNSLFWQTGQYDGGSRFFRAGETYEVEAIAWDGPGHGWVRLRQIWIDTYFETYWDKVVTTQTVTGTQIAETWLQGQNMWLDAVGIWFTRLAAVGSAHIGICEVSDYGLPNIKAMIGTTTLLRENMVQNAETVVPLQPVFLAGRQAVCAGRSPRRPTTGSLPFPVKGSLRARSSTFSTALMRRAMRSRTCGMRLYRCKFNQARATVTLTPLQLSGGIRAIDLLAGMVVPDGTTLSFEIQVGSTWYNLFETEKYMLGQGGTIPPLLPLRAVFNGSVDCQPAINLADSSVFVSRPDIYAQHVTKTRGRLQPRPRSG